MRTFSSSRICAILLILSLKANKRRDNTNPPMQELPHQWSSSASSSSSSSSSLPPLFSFLWSSTSTAFSFSSSFSSSSSSFTLVDAAAFADSVCPNGCSSKGLCNNNATCSCYDGFAGADCSRRLCPMGRVWAAKIHGGDSPDYDPRDTYAECSGVGFCDMTRTTCKCPSGYAGLACDTTSCLPSVTPCNGRGRCVSTLILQQLATSTLPGGPVVDPALLYSNWDAGRYMTCLCDPGYGGVDCGFIMCPPGDNPLTESQQRKVLKVKMEVAASLALARRRFRFWFAGRESRPIAIHNIVTADECVEAFVTVGNLDSEKTTCRVARPSQLSSVDGSVLSPTTYEFIVALSFPVSNEQLNWFPHTGDPPLTMFGCYVDPTIPDSEASGTTCEISFVDVQSLELVSSQSTPIPDGTTFTLAVENQDSYPNTVTVTRTEAGAPPVVSFLPSIPMTVDSIGVMLSAGDPIYVRWSTLWGHTKNAVWTLSSNALLNTVNCIQQPTTREYDMCSGIGICDFTSGTCKCPSSQQGQACELVANEVAPVLSNVPALALISQASDFIGTVLKINSKRPLSSAFNFITAADGDRDPSFTVRGDGTVVASSIDIANGGLIRTSLQVSLSSERAAMASGVGVLSVYYGNNVLAPHSDAPITSIVSEFALDATGANNYDVLRVSSRSQTVMNAQYTPLFAVRGDGRASVYNGITVGSGGISITAGGLSVTAGGLLVQAGISSLQGGVSVSNGIAIRSGGLSVLGPSTVEGITATGNADITGRITTTNGGISVNAGGLGVNVGGIYVGAGGLSVNAGNTFMNAGSVSVLAGSTYIQNGAYTAALAGGGGAASGGAASFSITAVGGFSGYTGDVVRINGPSSTSNNYNLLKITSDTASLVVDDNADIQSLDNLLISTSSSSAATGSGAISLVAGAATAGTGGKIAAVAGPGSVNGGDVSFVGGAGLINGGHSWLKGGAGGAGGEGGDVILQPGSGGSTAGEVRINDAGGTTRFAVTSTGQLLFTPSGGAASLASATSPIVTSATILSLTGSIGVVARGEDGAGGNAGGIVSLVGGTTSSSSTGGNIVIRPGGAASGGTDGSLRIFSASSTSYPLRITVDNTASTFFSDSAAAAMRLTYGNIPANSVLNIAGTTSVGGVTSLNAGAGVGVSLYVDGWNQIGGALSVGGLAFVNGVTSFGGASSIASTLQVADKVTIAANGMDVTGDIIAKTGDVNIALGALSVGGNVVHAGTVSVASTMRVTGATTLDSGLTVSTNGAIVSAGNLRILSGNADISGALSIGSSLITVGFTSLAGATTITGTVRATDLLTLTRGINLSPSPASLYLGGGPIYASGTTGVISVGGRLISGGSASVAGATTLTGTLTAIDAVTMGNGLGVTGDVTITSGTLRVLTAGQLGQFAGGMSVGGSTSLAGGTRAAGGMVVASGDLSVSSGDLTLSDASKRATVAGTLSTGYFAASNLIVCDSTAWSTGACSTLNSFSPYTASKFRLYWNADTVTHTVVYGGGLGAIIIQPGSTFPIYFL